MNEQFFESPRFAVKVQVTNGFSRLFTPHQDCYMFNFGGLLATIMKMKMKNLKVFTEVKKICTNFLYKKTLFAAR